MRILLDTSILMHLPEGGLRFEDIVPAVGKVELVVPKPVLKELRSIAKGSSRRARVARLALEYVSAFQTTPGRDDADDVIVRAAKSDKAAVATLDRELIRRVLSEGGTVVTLRQNRLVLLGKDNA